MLSPFGTFPFLFAAILTAPFALDLEEKGYTKAVGYTLSGGLSSGVRPGGSRLGTRGKK